MRGIQERGPGDYLVGSPTFTLLKLKWLFEQIMQLGTYVGSPVRRLTFSPAGAERLFDYRPSVPTAVYFGHA